MPYMIMEHDVDPKKAIQKELGDISSIEIYNNQILCAVYMRPEKTKSGLYLPDQHLSEDKTQSKVGLVLKKGPDAFIDSSQQWFKEMNISVGDWVVFRPSDGWGITVHGILCRILDDTNIKGRIQHPDQVW
jgi:co-chaperonin GroES (HSP10)